MILAGMMLVLWKTPRYLLILHFEKVVICSYLFNVVQKTPWNNGKGCIFESRFHINRVPGQ
jgi:hypothetical protein